MTTSFGKQGIFWELDKIRKLFIILQWQVFMSQKLPSFLYKKKLSPLAQEQELSCNAKDQLLGNIDIGSITIH